MSARDVGDKRLLRRNSEVAGESEAVQVDLLHQWSRSRYLTNPRLI